MTEPVAVDVRTAKAKAPPFFIPESVHTPETYRCPECRHKTAVGTEHAEYVKRAS
jgi:uncharacterized protein YlaI